MIRYAAFDTAIGPCGIAWRNTHIIATALPASDREDLLSHLRRRFPDGEEGPIPEALRPVVDGIVGHLAGEPAEYRAAPIAFEGGSEFEQRVWAATSAIPAGETRTYGQIAASVGEPGAARAVGRALGRNPVPIIVPCHRVLAADGRSGGFSAPGGVSTKMKLLEIERARRGDQPGLFDQLGWAART